MILGELTAVQKDVAASVHEDDLIRLGECMKKEQALSLSLRNIDQKRLRLQQQMGLEKDVYKRQHKTSRLFVRRGTAARRFYDSRTCGSACWQIQRA